MTALQELAEQIRRHATGPITQTVIPGLRLYHAHTDQPASAHLMYKPMVCVMAQGEKKVVLGETTLRYLPANYLIAAVDLPVTGTVSNAVPGQPYLALSLEIDTAVLSDLLLTQRPAELPSEPTCGLGVGTLSPALLECFVRMARLLDEPETVAHLAPLITREVLYRLLQDDQTRMLRQVVTRDTHGAGIARAMRWIREHYAEPFSTRVVADVANMSPASFHRHFRAVASMSPLQYQKQIRLQEARRLLVSSEHDAATTAFRVGYASPSQFSREYSRTFGKPPRQDAAWLQAQSGAAALL